MTALYPSILWLQIKLTVPSKASQSSDVRFAGSFVLYNFARLANLVRNFEKACNLGQNLRQSTHSNSNTALLFSSQCREVPFAT